MNSKNIYKEFISAKNGSLIPVLNSGRTIESRYNPEREAETQIQNFEKKYNAFLILGIGSGILMNKLKENYPDSLIIGVERSNNELSFLFNYKYISGLKDSDNIFFTTIENLQSELCEKYLPAKYGDLKIVEQRNWIFENQDVTEIIQKQIQSALKQISADLSVQSHFGKIWCNNIIHNLKLLSNQNNNYSLITALDRNKTAYIIAAGPSIDENINTIIKDTNKIVIATDTAFQILQKYKINPDIVVSLDGQNISYNHFMNSKKMDKTIYFFDLAGDFSASKNVPDENRFFFVSGHPFSSFVNNYVNNTLPSLFAGAGTVTISALDLAVKLGFKKIKVIGADFAYLNGKSYAKGTYLDSLYNYKTSKINSNENNYDKLLFRTPLEIINSNKYSTSVLDSYKKSFLSYLSINKLEYVYENNIYEIKNKIIKTELKKVENFNFIDFMNYLKSVSIEKLELSLLPLIAYFRKYNNYDENLEYSDFLKLAHSFIVSYN